MTGEMPMNCDQAAQLLDIMRTQEGDRESARELEEHLSVCAACRALSQDLARVANDFAALYIPAPRDIIREVMKKIMDRYDVIETKLGKTYVGFTTQGVSAVKLDVENSQAFESYYAARLGRSVAPGPLPATFAEAVQCAINGVKRHSLPVTMEGMTEFEKKVFDQLMKIPHGEVRPYSWLAREAGNPKAIRAVGTVMARNPVPFLLPCHRVVPTEGGVGNYYYGPEMKWNLLEREGIPRKNLEDWKRRGTRYVASKTTGIYCFPTCRDARRIRRPNYLEFKSVDAASKIGFRPCRRCKPMSA